MSHGRKSDLSESETLKNLISIREFHRDDLQAIRLVLDQTSLFPSDLLLSMAEPYFSGAAPHHWLVGLEDDRPLAFAYAEPERMTKV